MMSNLVFNLFDKFRGRRRIEASPSVGTIRAIGNLILPQACVLCAAPIRCAWLCEGCESTAPRLSASCPRCALPSRNGEPCSTCRHRPPPFSVARAAFVYAWPVDHLLHSLKYGGALSLAGWFAQAIAECGPVTVDLLVPIPLSPARQRERGYNQAGEIARHIARLTGVPLLNGLARVRDTGTQVGLSGAQRARNLREAFVGSDTLAGRRVALVDDVMTTGATMHAAARAASRAGALATEAWLGARTLSPESA